MVVLAVAFASAVQAGIIIGMAHQSNSISSMYNVLNSVSYASAESASLSLGGTNAGGFSIGFQFHTHREDLGDKYKPSLDIRNAPALFPAFLSVHHISCISASVCVCFHT